MRRTVSLLAVLLLVAGLVRADPLDKVTGTEDWAQAAPENIDAEWKEWYQGRVSWRRAGRELRAQRTISQRLAALLLRADARSFEQVRRIIEAGARPLATTEPPTEAPAGPRPRTRRRSPVAESERGGTYSNVPVERLDNLGQAIDEEGDRELRRLTGPGKKPAPDSSRKKKGR